MKTKKDKLPQDEIQRDTEAFIRYYELKRLRQRKTKTKNKSRSLGR